VDAAGPGEVGRPEISEAIREAGLRVTLPRLAVLRVFEESPGHHAVEDVDAMLRERGVELPKGSLYNVVHDLSRSGLLRQLDAGPGRAIYERVEDDGAHYHYVCTECGGLFDYDAGDAPAAIVPKHAPVESVQVTARGGCPFAGKGPAPPGWHVPSACKHR
jgi:Fur family ferric uptake transcriptional regulator